MLTHVASAVQVLSTLASQAWKCVTDLRVNHALKMSEAYTLCKWVPGEPLKAELLRIAERYDVIEGIHEAKSMEELIEAAAKGGGHVETVVAAHASLQALIRDNKRADSLPVWFLHCSSRRFSTRASELVEGGVLTLSPLRCSRLSWERLWAV